MKIFGKNYDDKKVKKIVYTAVFVAIILWFVYRFIMVAIESRMTVFNPIRDANKNGTLVETITAERQNGIINIPIAITNNRAYVSYGTRSKVRAGQNISGGGTIASVSSSLDFDSGMYVVQTRGAQDGVQNVLVQCDGFFIPVYAVRDEVVMIADSGVAHAQNVSVVAQDSDMACISDGIKNGDVVVLSKVSNNQKINVNK
ncbi:MAG: hypothetical protein IKS08_02765 [Alphaproteobacteria bacterium]|nr:hypothetical protein [Alphaproteobacteria bacterium]